MNDIKHIGIIEELKSHISLYSESSTMGDLLRGCKRLIDNQSADLQEKAVLINCLQSSEAIRIEQLKKAREDIDRLTVVRAKRNKNLKNS